MDFTPTEEQSAVRELAGEIFGDLSTHERLTVAGTGTDAELWKALCGVGLPAAVEETGLLGLVLALEEQGRTTAQVPFAASCVYGVLALAAHGSEEQRDRLLPALRDGTAVATGAFPAHGGSVFFVHGQYDVGTHRCADVQRFAALDGNPTAGACVEDGLPGTSVLEYDRAMWAVGASAAQTLFFGRTKSGRS